MRNIERRAQWWRWLCGAVCTLLLAAPAYAFTPVDSPLLCTKAGSGGSGVASATRYFQTSYDPRDWRGTIKAYGFTASGAVDTASVLWSTDTAIVPGAAAPTYQSWNNQTHSAVTLAFANLSATQQSALSQGLPSGITGSDLLEWSKGSNKAGLKMRTVLLGDISQLAAGAGGPFG